MRRARPQQRQEERQVFGRGGSATRYKTLPGKGWFTYIRLYGPLEPFFEQTWKPDDIVKV